MVMNGNDSEQGSFDMMVFQPDKTLLKGLKNFSQTTFEEAKNVIQNRMPSKILNLTELLREKNGYESFLKAEHEKSQSEQVDNNSGRVVEGLNKEDSPSKVSETFSLLESEFGLLKMEILELVEMAMIIKLWLQLNVPRIEDGNNFGVSIQTDTVSELSRIEDAALMTVENWSKFLMNRAKVISKMYKYEGSTGYVVVKTAYHAALMALDERQLRSVWIGWQDLRNNYSVLYDLVVKNIEKLVHPRSSNISNMY